MAADPAVLQTLDKVPERPQVYRLRDGVAKVARKGGIVLVSPVDGTTVRMSPVSEELMPLLADGAAFEHLAARLREKYPNAVDLAPKLSAFLDQLGRSGLLQTRERPRPRRWQAPRLPLFDPDPAASLLARALRAIPSTVLWSLLALAALTALTGVGALLWTGRVPHPGDIVWRFSGWGLAAFALLVVPLHEAAHALACRLAGVRVGMAGVILHGWLIPGPYVETTQAYRVRQRGPRFWIPAAGPLVNLLATGAAAWGLLLAPEHPPLGDAFATLFLLGVLFLYADTNPLTPSDGSRMLEALLDDELARSSALSRRRARLSSMKTVGLYRIAASMHLQGSIALLIVWWFQ